MHRSCCSARAALILVPCFAIAMAGLTCPGGNPLGGGPGDNANPGGSNNGQGGAGSPNPTLNFAPVIDQSDPIAMTVQRHSTCGGIGNQHTLTASDADGPSTQLTWYVRIAPQHGKATLVGNTVGAAAVVCYEPDLFQSQSDGFSIGVYDAKGDIDFVDFTVTVANTGPSITNPASTTLVVKQNSACSATENRITLEAVDPDGAGTELEWSVVTPPATGQVTLPGGKFGGAVAFCYAPNANQIASDQFVVQVRDEEGLADTIQIQVTVVNTPPSIVNAGGPQSLVVWKNSPCTSPFNRVTVTADDPDADESFLTWTVQSQPGHGTASIVGANTGGSIQVCFAPGAEQTAPTSFMMSVNDGTGGTATAQVNAEIRTSPMGGTWQGLTSQGQLIEFVLVEGAEPMLSSYKVVALLPCLGMGTFGCFDIPCDPVLLSPAASFDAGIQPLRMLGTFSSATNAAGSAHLAVNNANDPNCPNPIVVDVTWNASRTGP